MTGNQVSTQSRTIGLILVAIAGLATLAAGALLVAQVQAGETTVPGALLGLLIVLVVLALPLGGGGAYLVAKGKDEGAQLRRVGKQRKVLDMVLTQGKVTLAECALEIQVTRDEVEDLVRDLVGRELFSGAIDWKGGVLYSKEAAKMKSDSTCPSCGGRVELAGKGVVKCAYCGSEVFLSS